MKFEKIVRPKNGIEGRPPNFQPLLLRIDLCSDSTCKCTPLRVCGLSIDWHGYTIIR